MRYSAFIIDHVKNPRNVGELPEANAKAKVRSATDGDLLQLHMKIQDDTVIEARFKVFGCGAAIATGSLLTEIVTGKTVAELGAITNEVLAAMMGGLPPEKIHCSVLAEQAIAAALEDWAARKT
jgi:nitrogen fixation protein NifU and related proteins